MKNINSAVATSALHLLANAIVHQLDRHDLICALATLNPLLCKTDDAALIAAISEIQGDEEACFSDNPALWVANETAGCLNSHSVRASVSADVTAAVKAGLETAWAQVLELSAVGSLDVADYDELQILFAASQLSGDAA